jgi:hypothetical protein
MGEGKKCWGRTRDLRRCRQNRQRWLFCWTHRYQWLYLVMFIVFTVGGSMASYYGAFTSHTENKPLASRDFGLRLSFADFNLTKGHLAQLPRAVHIEARFRGTLTLSFDLRLLEEIYFGSSRGASIPQIIYNAENLTAANLRGVTHRDLAGAQLSFAVPWSIRTVLPEGCQYQIELYVEDQWYTSGAHHLGGGVTSLEIPQPKGKSRAR